MFPNILQELNKPQLKNWVGKPKNAFLSAPLQEANGCLLLTFDWAAKTESLTFGTCMYCSLKKNLAYIALKS